MFGRTTFVAGLALLVLLVAGCDGGGMKPAGEGGDAGPSGPVTGLLIVAQTFDGDTVDMAHKTVVTWNIVDQSGSKIIGKDQIDPAFLNAKGMIYEWHRTKATTGKNLWLGKNYKEIQIAEVKLTGDEKKQTATLVVDGENAAALRAIPNLDDLVRKCQMVFLLGKIGQ